MYNSNNIVLTLLPCSPQRAPASPPPPPQRPHSPLMDSGSRLKGQEWPTDSKDPYPLGRGGRGRARGYLEQHLRLTPRPCYLTIACHPDVALARPLTASLLLVYYALGVTESIQLLLLPCLLYMQDPGLFVVVQPSSGPPHCVSAAWRRLALLCCFLWRVLCSGWGCRSKQLLLHVLLLVFFLDAIAGTRIGITCTPAGFPISKIITEDFQLRHSFCHTAARCLCSYDKVIGIFDDRCLETQDVLKEFFLYFTSSLDPSRVW